MAVKAWDIRQRRTVIPEQWETNKVNSTIVPVHCIKSLQAQHQETEPKRCPENSPSWGDGAESSGRPKQLGFTGQSPGKERAIQRRSPKDVWRAIKILEKKAGKNLFDLGCSNFLLNTSPEARETSKNQLLGPHQNKKLLHSEGNKQQN